MNKICRGKLEHVRQPVCIVAAVRYIIAGNSELNATAMA